jgi:hypothetical protein
MEKFQLSAFLNISGIGAASGIVYTHNSLFIISDSSGFLYQYQLQTNQLSKHALIANPSENIVKKQKPDFEAITLKEDQLHIFGSGSTQNRNKNIVYDLETQKIHENDLTLLYQNIKSKLNISDEELNIEGALFFQEMLYLFQRGNGANSKNGIIRVNVNNNQQIDFTPVQLPKIKHVETTFTDAVLLENKIYFLAAAEDTLSTYEDGEVLGSIIGCIDVKTLKIDFSHQISQSQKFEGLSLFEKTSSNLVFLLCEDNDTEKLESTIYKLTIDI